VALGSCGVAVLRWGGSFTGVATDVASVPITGTALTAALLATACWGLAAQNYRRHLSGLNALHVTALSFQVMGFVILSVLTLQFDAPSFRSHADWLPMLSLLGLAILSVVAVTGYNWLIARWGAVRASSCTYVVPLVALLWGYAQAEPLGWHVALACALVASAMWAVRQPVQNAP
jgi:drug/metabolite transporter (DMT)-like permease